jgi:hypothetical protein
MISLPRLLPMIGLVLGVVAMAGSQAEAGGREDGAPPPVVGEGTMRHAIAAALAQATPAPAPPRGSRTRRGAVRGALIGAGAGAAVGIIAAAARGNNEGGSICGVCALQWGGGGAAIGAGIGAGVGAAIGAGAPSRQPGMPLAPDRSLGRRRGVAFAVRF